MKKALRKEASARRDALASEARTRASEAASARVVVLPGPKKRVAVFAARGSEIDPEPLAEWLGREGAAVAYPRVEGHELVFARASKAELVSGGFGLLEPPPTAEVILPSRLDLILVPGLLFDPETGHRLGYGKGYFDRVLGALREKSKRPLFVGFGFESQLWPGLPSSALDVPVDVLVTEADTRWFTDPKPLG